MSNTDAMTEKFKKKRFLLHSPRTLKGFASFANCKIVDSGVPAFPPKNRLFVLNTFHRDSSKPFYKHAPNKRPFVLPRYLLLFFGLSKLTTPFDRSTAGMLMEQKKKKNGSHRKRRATLSWLCLYIKWLCKYVCIKTLAIECSRSIIAWHTFRIE